MWRDPIIPTTNNSQLCDDILTLLKNKNVSASDKKILSTFLERWNTANNLLVIQESILKSLKHRYKSDIQEEYFLWLKEYDDEKKANFALALKYYDFNGIFAKQIYKFIQNPSLLPTRKQYKNLCENKYFLKAKKIYESQPRYNIGDIVVFKKSRIAQDGFYIVEDIIKSDKSFYAGSRYYKLMLIGTGESDSASETEIKLYREKKCLK